MLHALELSPFFAVPGALRPRGRHGWRRAMAGFRPGEMNIIGDTLWWTYKKLLKMAIEIVDFPIKNGDFPLLC